MAHRFRPFSPPETGDDFQRAAAQAKAEAGDRWVDMPVREQARAIYAQLRRIDSLRAFAGINVSEPRDAPPEMRELVAGD